MTKPKMVYPEGVEQNDEGATHYPPPRLEQPKSECKCIDKPELETLSYKPTKPSRATEDETTPIIEPETQGENSEVVGQHLCHQTMTSRECIGCSIDAAGKCPLDIKPEQPNQNLMIIKTIQGLMDVIEHNLSKLQKAVE